MLNLIICSCVNHTVWLSMRRLTRRLAWMWTRRAAKRCRWCLVRIENELCQSDLELTDQTNVGQLQVTSSAQKIPGFGDNSRDSIWQSDLYKTSFSKALYVLKLMPYCLKLSNYSKKLSLEFDPRKDSTTAFLSQNYHWVCFMLILKNLLFVALLCL